MTDTYSLGAAVPLTFEVVDSNGDLVDDATSVTLTITLPNGSTVTQTLHHPDTGVYTADYATVQAGRHTARFVVTGPNAGAVDDVFDVIAMNLAYVTLGDVKAYLGDSSVSDSEITKALAAEQAAQASRCRLDPYTADLREALLRRCARNLAARSVPVTSFSSFDGAATVTRVPATDAEVARLEAPYRRLVIG